MFKQVRSKDVINSSDQSKLPHGVAGPYPRIRPNDKRKDACTCLTKTVGILSYSRPYSVLGASPAPVRRDATKKYNVSLQPVCDEFGVIFWIWIWYSNSIILWLIHHQSFINNWNYWWYKNNICCQNIFMFTSDMDKSKQSEFSF